MPNLYPFQQEAVTRALEILTEYDGALLALEQGLGKSATSLRISEQLDARNILIVCPASLKINWQREITLWTGRESTILSGRKAQPTGTGIEIVNYDILQYIDFSKLKYDMLIFDESHYLKSWPPNKRTKAASKIPRKNLLLLTGTPMISRPRDLFSSILLCGAAEKKNWISFAFKFCAAYYEWVYVANGSRRKTLNTEGASNLEHLYQWMQRMTIRKLKADVLTDLPDKTYRIIELPRTAIAPARMTPGEMDEAILNFEHSRAVAFEEFSLVRHEEATDKVPAMLDYLNEVQDKAVVFFYHTDVGQALFDAFADNAVMIIGGMSSADKQIAVDRFQNDPSVQWLFGQITAAGVGITLTAASHVIMAECPWTSAELDQCADRCHRIGQKDNVLVDVLVVEDTLDIRIVKTVVRKQKLANVAIDGK